MFKVLISITILFTLKSYGTTIEFIGPCDEKPLVTLRPNINSNIYSVGKLTVQSLINFNIPFLGNEMGISSIFNTPTGDEAIEIISDYELKAYGWCFSINGYEPGVYPSEINVLNSDKVLWWFGYAHYKDSQWISQCTPAHLKPSPKFCSKR